KFAEKESGTADATATTTPEAGAPVTPGSSAAMELSTSPLIEKMKAVAAYREALKRLPNEKLCVCKCDERCVPQNPCCAKIKSFITDVMVVRDHLHCYLPHEIAYVENVLAGEKRTRKHENFLQI
ncbi:MAG: hypothetical protein DMF74_17855, partial [Acidobacteria bacterium]